MCQVVMMYECWTEDSAGSGLESEFSSLYIPCVVTLVSEGAHHKG